MGLNHSNELMGWTKLAAWENVKKELIKRDRCFCIWKTCWIRKMFDDILIFLFYFYIMNKKKDGKRIFFLNSCI